MPGELTPRNNFPYPSERQEPYYQTYKSGELARDAAHWAHAENDLITYTSDANFSWNATTATLTWSKDINIKTFTTRNKIIITAGSKTLQDGEVLFFNMPRLLVQDATIELQKGSIIRLANVRLHDLRIFATRTGDTVFFFDNSSLLDGESAILFGGGVSSGSVATATSAPGGGTQGVVTADEDKGLLINTGIMEVKIDNSSIQYNVSGELEAVGGGVVNVATGASGDGGTLGITRADIDKGLNINGTGTMEVKVDASTINFNVSGQLEVQQSALTGAHQHLAPVIIEPGIGITDLDAQISNATNPAYIQIMVYRNGQRLVEGALRDYTFDDATGIVTLTLATQNANERFIIDRIGTV